MVDNQSVTTKRNGSGPLKGFRILEFSLALAGPFAGLQLADFGADVIKVEPIAGDTTRYTREVIPGESKVFQTLNRGRRGLCLDLSTSQAREIVYRLMPSVDAVLCNYRPGVAKRLGIDYHSLRELRRDVVYAEISGYGAEGPLASLRASEMTAAALGGAIALTGAVEADGTPFPVRPALAADEPAGLAAAMGILAALLNRERTGEGQLIHVSLLRSVLMMTRMANSIDPVQDSADREILIEAMAEARESGGEYADLIRARHERITTSPFFRAYNAKDGAIVLGALTPPNRMAMRQVLDIPGTDPHGNMQMATLESKAAAEATVAAIAQRLATRTVAEWLQLFEEAGAPVAPVLFPEELLDHPQTSLHYSRIEHPLSGTTRQASPMVDFSTTPTKPGPAPLLGQHTREILLELGYDDSEISALHRAGKIGLHEE